MSRASRVRDVDNGPYSPAAKSCYLVVLTGVAIVRGVEDCLSYFFVLWAELSCVQRDQYYLLCLSTRLLCSRDSRCCVRRPTERTGPASRLALFACSTHLSFHKDVVVKFVVVAASRTSHSDTRPDVGFNRIFAKPARGIPTSFVVRQCAYRNPICLVAVHKTPETSFR